MARKLPPKKPTNSRNRQPAQPQSAGSRRRRRRRENSGEIATIVTLFFGLISCLGVYTPWAGIFGRWLRTAYQTSFGAIAYITPPLILITGVFVGRNRKKLNSIGAKYFLAFLLNASIAALWHASFFRSFGAYPISQIAATASGGGFIGAILSVPLVSFMGQIGTIVLLVTTTIVLISTTYNLSYAQIAASTKALLARIEERRLARYEEAEYEEDYYDYPEPEPTPPIATSPEQPKPQKPRKAKKPKELKEPKRRIEPITTSNSEEPPWPTDDDVPAASVLPKKTFATIVPSSQIEPGKIEVSEIIANLPEVQPVIEAATPRSEATEEPIQNIENIEPIKSEAIKEPEEIETEIEELEAELPPAPKKPYILPPPSLLNPPVAKDVNLHMESLEAAAKKLLETLASFGVSAKIVDYSMGPTVTRYELQPKAGVKISKIVNLADDIALNLAAIGVRIEAPIPGKAAIGIEIPNEVAAAVNIIEAIDTKHFTNFSSKLAFALGMDISGNPHIIDIARMPHLLIAGSTGSGKSVCINTLITSLLYKAKPDEVKLILIDPKMVELQGYNGIPHLLIPVVTDPQKAAGALAWAVKEMTNRYKLFAQNNVRDLKGYNTLMENEGNDKMPQIVIIIDELADLMMVAPNDVEDAICRLAQMARAAGMHLVIATQRPSVDVITGIIKANIPSRISFAVSSQIDSRTILDMAGAEKLIGRGDMLYAPIGSNKPIRVQGCFVSDEEVNALVEYVKQFNQTDYDEEVADEVNRFETSNKGKRPANGNGNGNGDEDNGKADDLLPAAIEMAIETGQASVAMYQRRLKVGYQRAARLIDQMETRGIIGPFEGTKPRQILITRQQFNEMMMNEPTEAPPA